MDMTIITRYNYKPFFDSIECQAGIDLQNISVICLDEENGISDNYSFPIIYSKDYNKIFNNKNPYLICFVPCVLSNYLILNTLKNHPENYIADETSIYINNNSLISDYNALLTFFKNSNIFSPNYISLPTKEYLYIDIFRKEQYYKNKSDDELNKIISDYTDIIENDKQEQVDWFVTQNINRAFLAHFLINVVNKDLYKNNSYAQELIVDYCNCTHFIVELLTKDDFYNRGNLINLNISNIHNVSNKIIENYAYVFYLSRDTYVKATITAYLSLLLQHPKYPIYCCVTKDISLNNLKLLSFYGISLITVDSIYPNDVSLQFYKNQNLATNNWYKAFGKLAIWNLAQFDKIVYIDVDTLIVGNCDDLFKYPDLSAVPVINFTDNIVKDTYFNSGVMVIKPDKETYLNLIRTAQYNTDSHVFNDEFLLMAYFKDWEQRKNNKLPLQYNVITYDYFNYVQYLANGSNDMKILHFSGTKPWDQDFHRYHNLSPLTRMQSRNLQLCLILYYSLYHSISTLDNYSKILSIIIPSHGEPLTKMEPLFKALQLQRKVNWNTIEILFGNNASRINEIKEAYPKELLPYTLFFENNTGFPGDHRQYLLEKCSGKYVWMIDVDDSLNGINAIQQVMTDIEKDSLCDVFDYDNLLTDNGRDFIVDEKFNCSTLGNKIMKLKYIQENNIKFHPDLKTCEDCYFLETMRQNKNLRWKHINKVIYHHTVYHDSTGSAYGQTIENFMRSFTDIMKKMDFELKYFNSHDSYYNAEELFYNQVPYLYYSIEGTYDEHIKNNCIDMVKEYLRTYPKIKLNYEKCSNILKAAASDYSFYDWLIKVIKYEEK